MLSCLEILQVYLLYVSHIILPSFCHILIFFVEYKKCAIIMGNLHLFSFLSYFSYDPQINII